MVVFTAVWTVEPIYVVGFVYLPFSLTSLAFVDVCVSYEYFVCHFGVIMSCRGAIVRHPTRLLDRVYFS